MQSENKRVIGVIGAGTMGRGIVQLFAQAGHTVYLYDAVQGAVDEGLSSVMAMINKLVEKGRVDKQVAESVSAGLHACKAMEELAACDVVIEAIIENTDIKRKVFAQLEGIVSQSAILASNTSSLLIADIANACEFPHRVAGLHFFNPVPLMRVAEVIWSARTADATVATLKNLVEGAGHRAVVAVDQPGFLVNHAGRGLYTEGLRLLEEGVATCSEVDRVLREVAGFRMGPFELLDLTGLDVSGKVMEAIYEQFQQEPFFRPSSLVRPRMAAGLFGRKTGEGWYAYEDGKKIEAREQAAPEVPGDVKIRVDPAAAQAKELAALLRAAGATLVNAISDATILIIQPWGIDASQACFDKNLDATRVVAIDPLATATQRRTVMTTPVTRPECRDAVHALLVRAGCAVTVINDSPGFIVQRVLAVIVNIAANIAQRRIANVADIEAAVTLGLGYPKGPLTWGNEIGGDKVLAILEGMHSVTKDPRYRPSLWLRRRAQLGVSLLTEEQFS